MEQLIEEMSHESAWRPAFDNMPDCCNDHMLEWIQAFASIAHYSKRVCEDKDKDTGTCSYEKHDKWIDIAMRVNTELAVNITRSN